MRNVVCAFCISILVISCSRENIPLPQPQSDLRLQRSVDVDPSGFTLRITHYNELELMAFDTVYQWSTRAPGMMNTYVYNGKGKRTLMESTIPALYTGGVYWTYKDNYKNDTIPTITYRYIKERQVAEITHFYNASGQLVLDSTKHTPNYGTFTYLTNYEYDLSGQLGSSLELNDTRDTAEYITYQYFPNKVEKSVLEIDEAAGIRWNSKTVTEYTSSGKILSEKLYAREPLQLSSQTDYTYDANGVLVKKLLVQPGSDTKEERYFINLLTGKPEKMEYYLNGQLGYTRTYYYQ